MLLSDRCRKSKRSGADLLFILRGLGQHGIAREFEERLEKVKKTNVATDFRLLVRT